MQVDHLIVGQGICGTFLSWYMEKANRSFVIIDEPRPEAASRVAAGIINPVTGRRIVKTWMIDEIMPFAKQAYEEIGSELSIAAIEQKSIIDFFPTPQMKLAFHDRFQQDSQYLAIPTEQLKWKDHFNDDFGYGEISPCLLVNLPELLTSYRTRVQPKLREEIFDIESLQCTDSGIRYKDIFAGSIIFCEGAVGAYNPYFKLLPFAPNKGEILWIESSDIPSTHIYKNGINIVPWQNNIFWVGSSYQWNFENDQPTDLFRERTVAHLKYWLKSPFSVVDHKASVRPATLERRPFAGFHPVQKNIGIFNGMGVKGCSLSPFFAKQFVEHIVTGSSLLPDVDISRFKNILSKNPYNSN